MFCFNITLVDDNIKVDGIKYSVDGCVGKQVSQVKKALFLQGQC